jgi:hypothetical protein
MLVGIGAQASSAILKFAAGTAAEAIKQRML